MQATTLAIIATFSI